MTNIHNFWQIAGWLVTGLMPIAASFLFAYWGYNVYFSTFLFCLGIVIATMGHANKAKLIIFFTCMLLATSISLVEVNLFMKHHYSWSVGIIFAYMLVVVGMLLYLLMTYRWNIQSDIAQLLFFARQNSNDLGSIKAYIERMNAKLSINENEYTSLDDYIVSLSIEATDYEDVEVKVENPARCIRDLINSIIDKFELPTIDAGGNPLKYMLCKLNEGEDEPVIFEEQDENGCEMNLLDYNVQPSDRLVLVRCVQVNDLV